MLMRRALPLALARLEIPDTATLVDLDDPAVLGHERLRPSRVEEAGVHAGLDPVGKTNKDLRRRPNALKI